MAEKDWVDVLGLYLREIWQREWFILGEKLGFHQSSVIL
jgi:hypothetical protein